MQQGSILHSHRALRPISAATSVEDTRSIDLLSYVSQKTWETKTDQALNLDERPRQPPLPLTPLPWGSSTKPAPPIEPAIRTITGIEVLAFNPEVRYAAVERDVQDQREANMRSAPPAQYFSNQISMHRTRSGSEGYQVEYSHPPGLPSPMLRAEAQTPSPENSIFRSFSCDEEDNAIVPFNVSPRRTFSPNHFLRRNFNSSESLMSDITLTEEEANYFIINNEPLTLENVIKREVRELESSSIETVLAQVLRTASKPIRSPEGDNLDQETTRQIHQSECIISPLLLGHVDVEGQLTKRDQEESDEIEEEQEIILDALATSPVISLVSDL